MSYVSGDHCYVLVRVARHRETANLAAMDMESTDLHEPVAKQVASVSVGDSLSVIEFVRSFGSHYVTSYVTGNSLYQVFTSVTTIVFPSIKIITIVTYIVIYYRLLSRRLKHENRLRHHYTNARRQYR